MDNNISNGLRKAERRIGLITAETRISKTECYSVKCQTAIIFQKTFIGSLGTSIATDY